MGSSTDVGRVIVIIPTYNECENLPEIVERVRASVPAADILVADDNSPDGTGDVADKLVAADDQVHVLHRADKQGLGAAYIAGFRWALERDYDVLVEMDADGSHRPEQLPSLLAALDDGADLVLGSRWVPGGRVRNWPKSREFLSRGANLYAQLALGISLRDATGGYRAFRATALKRIDLAHVQSQGYCFQVDLALRAVRGGLRVVEVPITFVDRVRGASKMSSDVMREAFFRVTVWGIGYRLPAVRRAYRSLVARAAARRDR